jgi:peptide/nickel transport system ATP-binding protein
MERVLEVEGLTTQFSSQKGKLTVVEDVHFYIRSGEILGIVGESGCGKSITSLSIMRLLGSNGESRGQVKLKGIDLLQLSEKEMRRIRGNQISMIFQEPMTSLNPVLTIERQIGEVLTLHQGVKRSEARDKVIELLQLVGIPRAEEIIQDYPHRLSGGMRQRVMIAMAIACNPELLIADEPTTALDVTIQAQILDLMKKLRKEIGMSMMLITHDLGVVAEMCDRVMVMYAGEVIETADVRTLLREPKHPYTVGLIQSTPQNSKGKNRLDTIPGTVPSPGEVTKGCRFASRCEQVMDVCMEQSPVLEQVNDRTQCRCWLYSSMVKKVELGGEL